MCVHFPEFGQSHKKKEQTHTHTHKHYILPTHRHDNWMCFSTEFQLHTDHTFHKAHCFCLSGCIVFEGPGFEGPLWEPVYRAAGPEALLTEAQKREQHARSLALAHQDKTLNRAQTLSSEGWSGECMVHGGLDSYSPAIHLAIQAYRLFVQMTLW